MPCIIERTANAEEVIAVVTRGVQLWRIFYGDGLVARSEDVSWRDAPRFNVQAVLVFRLSPRGDCLHSEARAGLDEYYLEGHDEVKLGAWSNDFDRIMLAVQFEVRQQNQLGVNRFFNHGS